jgi:hypothetical protein
LSLVRTKTKIRSISNPSESETPMTLRTVLGSLLITIISSAPPIASAAPPSACTRADYLEGRKQFTKFYRAGQFAESVEALTKIKQNCWDILDETDRGWLISDLTLGAGKAGRPDLCRQLVAAAPKDLDPESRVAKAIHFNEEHCEDKPAADAAKPAQADGALLPVVVWPALGVASVADVAQELQKTWQDVWHTKRPRRTISRCSDIGRAKPADIEVENDPEYYSVLVVWLRCRALEIIAAGKPAAHGYVRQLLTVKNPGSVLPPVMAFEMANEDKDQQKAAARAGKSWRSFAGKLTFEPENARHEIWVSGDEFGGPLEWWAAGDFDGDGFDDIIVYRVLGPDQGTFGDIKAFVLTRTTPSGILKVIKKL